MWCLIHREADRERRAEAGGIRERRRRPEREKCVIFPVRPLRNPAREIKLAVAGTRRPDDAAAFPLAASYSFGRCLGGRRGLAKARRGQPGPSRRSFS